MTAPAFDEVVHAPHRLRIMAALAVAESAEFAAIREMLAVADSVLSKHLKVLQDAGYVVLDKPVGRDGWVRTWVRPTPEGRRVYGAHIAALLELVAAPSAPTSREVLAGVRDPTDRVPRKKLCGAKAPLDEPRASAGLGVRVTTFPLDGITVTFTMT